MKAGKVYSMRKGAEAPPHDAVRIDRQTKWGNPYLMPGGEADRGWVVDRYRDWLWLRMKASPSFVSELVELAGRPLVCWCAPMKCHGDILAAAAVWAAANHKKELA